MRFGEDKKVLINTMNKDEARAFVLFLESEIMRHQDDINEAICLMRHVYDEILCRD